MSDFPSVTCRIAFDSNALDPNPTWTDVSADVLKFSIRRGRQFELDRIEPGQAFITLRNLDGAYWPDKTDSPHHPEVKPGKRLELTTTAFSGFPSVVLADSPDGYWRLDEASGQAQDSSANANHSTQVNAVQGRPSLLAGNPAIQGGAYEFNRGGHTVEIPADSAVANIWDGGGCLAFLASPLRDFVGPRDVMAKSPSWHVSLTQRSGDWFHLTLHVGFSGGGGEWRTTERAVKANARNVVSIHYNSDSPDNDPTAHVNGTAVGMQRVTSPSGVRVDDSQHSLRFGSDGSRIAFRGRLQDVAVFKTDPGGDRAEAWARTAAAPSQGYWLFTGFIESWDYRFLDGALGGQSAPVVELTVVDGLKNLRNAKLDDVDYPQEQAGARIGRVLDALGWPAADRDLDPGQTAIQAATDLTNETALSHLDKVLFSELGALFVDSRNAMTFQERYGRLREPYDASQATYGDSPGARSYVGIELEQTDQNVYNDVRIEPKDGTEQISVDETSQTAYGRRTLTRSNLLMTRDTEAKDQADILLSRFKDPALRLRSISVRPQRDPAALFPDVLGFDLSTRIKVQLGASGLDADHHIEGVEHDVRMDPRLWETRWWLSRAETYAFWTLGVSKLGTETRLGF
ncbi:MAG: hypothetical protein OXR64_07455 [Chloroflexota bacterium]|nr:hypothetical protein [Chloroflexota bacterium]MDE2919666.1 hypothetical protein [Chloroflexota bacterium]